MFSQHEGDSDRIGFDMALLMAMGFLFIILILIQFIAEKKPSEEAIQQGNVIVELYWDDRLETDVDLWVQAPHDVPVGYSNLGGRVFNLLRDDLGNEAHVDASGRNMEIAVSRGIVAGDYIVNAHLFHLDGEDLPIKIRGVVSIKPSDTEPTKQLFSVDTKLQRVGHEKTLVQFKLDKTGKVHDVHYTQKFIRPMNMHP